MGSAAAGAPSTPIDTADLGRATCSTAAGQRVTKVTTDKRTHSRADPMPDEPTFVFTGLDPIGLLAAWFQWWVTTDDAPAKMPDSLHVRTLMVLIEAGFIDEDGHIKTPQLGRGGDSA